MNDASREAVPQQDGDVAMARPGSAGWREVGSPGATDYREQLRSRRWDAAPLANPEVERSDPRVLVAFIAAISAVTFVLLVLGYWSGFWG